MKLLFDQDILAEDETWIEEIQSHFPYLRLDLFSQSSEIALKSKGEKCLILSSAATLLQKFAFFSALDSRAFPIMAVGDAVQLRQLQSKKMELAGAILLPISVADIVETIQQYQLAFRPKEFSDQSLTIDQHAPIESEDAMAAKEIEIDELELDDIVLDDDNGDELVLDSDIDDSVGALEVDFDQDGSGIAFDLGGSDSSMVIETSDKNHGSTPSSADELNLEGENELDLSFGGLELSTDGEESEGVEELESSEELDTDSSNSSLVFSVGNDDEVEAPPAVESTGEFDIDFSVSADEEDEQEAAESVDTVEAVAEIDDDNEIFGDALDLSGDESEEGEISSEEEEALDLGAEGTVEFDLSADDDDQLLADEETSDEVVIPEDLPEDNIPSPIIEKNQTKTVLNTSEPLERRAQTVMVRDKVDYNFDENEMVRLQVTLRGLKEEREKLLSTIQQQKNEIEELAQNNLGLKAEVDDQKIEIALLKKRYHEKTEDANYHIRVSDEKKQLYEEKMRKMQHEFDQLNQKVRLDLTRVKQREKELESQLELIKMDADAQIKGRDQKIMELKRKIDSLEFNMENMAIREQQSKETHHQLEQKLHKLMGTLKGSMKILEEDSASSDDYKGKEG